MVDSDKRTPMGFFGMRGKKDYDDEILDEEKRSPSGFFGMRGKKMRSSGFFGMRGKKYPYEFRGKFVGVRGKKSTDTLGPDYYNNGPDLGNLGQDLDLNQLMLLLTDNEDAQRKMWRDTENDVASQN